MNSNGGSAVVGTDEKRRIQRIRLYSPITAHLGEERVAIVDISSSGARIERHAQLHVGDKVRIEFAYATTIVALDCDIVRCKLEKSVTRDAIVYTAGLRFCADQQDLVNDLLNMVKLVVEHDYEARKDFLGQND